MGVKRISASKQAGGARRNGQGDSRAWKDGRAVHGCTTACRRLTMTNIDLRWPRQRAVRNYTPPVGDDGGRRWMSRLAAREQAPAGPLPSSGLERVRRPRSMLLATAPALFFRGESRRRQDGARRCFNAVGLLQGVLRVYFPSWAAQPFVRVVISFAGSKLTKIFSFFQECRRRTMRHHL
jgi:hypothetical protein